MQKKRLVDQGSWLVRMKGVIPQGSTIRTYCIVLLVQTLLGLAFNLFALGYSTNCRKYPVYHVIKAEDGIHIFRETVTNQVNEDWLHDLNFVGIERFLLKPYNEVGPLKGMLEFYRYESFLSEPLEFDWHLTDITPSQSEKDYVYQELIKRSMSDSYLARFQPGSPPKISFLPMETLMSLTRVGVYFGLPAFFTWLIGYSMTYTKKAIVKNRKLKGLCIYCSYDCRKLPSSICPECGNPHMVDLEPPILQSHA
jgi:hypothetical protein